MGEMNKQNKQLKHALEVALVQTYNLKQGLNKFGVEEEELVSKELTQHRDLDTYSPVDPKTLTREDKRQALRSLIFLTKKRCGRVKTRMVVGGSK